MKARYTHLIREPPIIRFLKPALVDTSMRMVDQYDNFERRPFREPLTTNASRRIPVTPTAENIEQSMCLESEYSSFYDRHGKQLTYVEALFFCNVLGMTLIKPSQ